jgi:hypothetical protein
VRPVGIVHCYAGKAPSYQGVALGYWITPVGASKGTFKIAQEAATETRIRTRLTRKCRVERGGPGFIVIIRGKIGLVTYFLIEALRSHDRRRKLGLLF